MIDMRWVVALAVVALVTWAAIFTTARRSRAMATGEPLDTTWHDMGRGVRWKVLPLDSLRWDCVVIQTGGTANIECMRQFR